MRGSATTPCRRSSRGAAWRQRVGPAVVALPTTAGSGAEVSHGAIVLDRGAGRKRGIRGPGVAADVALVDPELVASSDAETTAAAGLDAIAHAIETALSKASSPFARTLSAMPGAACCATSRGPSPSPATPRRGPGRRTRRCSWA